MNLIVLLRAVIFLSSFCRSDCFWVRLQQDVLTYYPNPNPGTVKPAWDLFRLLTGARKRFCDRYPRHGISSKLCQLLIQLLDRVQAALDGQDCFIEQHSSEPAVSATPEGPAWDEKTSQFRRMMAHPNFVKVFLKRSVTELSSLCFFPPIETIRDPRKRGRKQDKTPKARKRPKIGDPTSGIDLTGQTLDFSRGLKSDDEDLKVVVKNEDDGRGEKCKTKYEQLEDRIYDLDQISSKRVTSLRTKQNDIKQVQKSFSNKLTKMRSTISLLEKHIQELRNTQECQLTAFRYELENFWGVVSGQHTQVQALQGKLDETNQTVLKLQDRLQHMARDSQLIRDPKMQIDQLRLEVASLKHAVSQSVRASRKIEADSSPYTRPPQPASRQERCTMYYSAPRPAFSRLSDAFHGGYSQLPKDARNDMGMPDKNSNLSREPRT